MPDWDDSTRLPAPRAQEALTEIVDELRQLDERLRTLVEAIGPKGEEILGADLRAGVECIRADLLSDAISTLSALAALTEDAALERRFDVAVVNTGFHFDRTNGENWTLSAGSQSAVFSFG